MWGSRVYFSEDFRPEKECLRCYLETLFLELNVGSWDPQVEGSLVAYSTIPESSCNSCKLFDSLEFVRDSWAILYTDLKLLFFLNLFPQRSQTVMLSLAGQKNVWIYKVEGSKDWWGLWESEESMSCLKAFIASVLKTLWWKKYTWILISYLFGKHFSSSYHVLVTVILWSRLDTVGLEML